jgi:hypothetical protein
MQRRILGDEHASRNRRVALDVFIHVPVGGAEDVSIPENPTDVLVPAYGEEVIFFIVIYRRFRPHHAIDLIRIFIKYLIEWIPIYPGLACN